MWQTIWVALLVPACTGYAAWKLMPGAGRRAIAVRMAGWPALPGGTRRWAEGVVRSASSGCGCDGCDHKPPTNRTAGATSRPIVLHRRPPGSARPLSNARRG